MSAVLLDGKSLAKQIKERVRLEVERMERKPGMAVVLVGENPATRVYVDGKTRGRVQLGPATLYTILGKFEKEGLIAETEVQGRKRTYAITRKGLDAYNGELARLRLCIADAEAPDDAYLPQEAPRKLTGETAHSL